MVLGPTRKLSSRGKPSPQNPEGRVVQEERGQTRSPEADAVRARHRQHRSE